MTKPPFIKPIETTYNGYRFRSRLEARWAVFFDALGVSYEYEKEGFNVNGTPYLPDFYIPHIDTWVEIKPGPSNVWPDHVVFDAIASIPIGAESDFPIGQFVVLVGTPSLAGNDSYCGYVCGDNNYYWCECKKCGKIGIEYFGYSNRICKGQCHMDRQSGLDTPRLLAAYSAARQARFEHGEKPLF